MGVSPLAVKDDDSGKPCRINICRGQRLVRAEQPINDSASISSTVANGHIPGVIEITRNRNV